MTQDPARTATAARDSGDQAALSGDDIALLSDIGGTTSLMEDEATTTRVARLIDEGYVRRDNERAKEGLKEGLKLTSKAQDVLAARGAGLNEA